MSEFYFIRHGQTDWNAQGLWQGSIDIELNEAGHQQAAQAATLLSGLSITQIIVSPMKRCLQTLVPIDEQFNVPVSHEIDLRERCFGALNGTPKSEIDDANETILLEYGAEPYQDFLMRTRKAVESHINRDPHTTILFVSHGGVFSALHDALIGIPKSCQNAVPYRFIQENKEWKITEYSSINR